MYTIVIAAGDATSSSASDLNTINEKTTEAINASAITALASDTIDNIKTLLTAGNDTDQFTETSFASLTGVTVSDETLDGSKLADAIDQANSATGDTSVVFTISAANTIEGSEANFTALLTDEGNNQIDIDDQDISVSGTISVDNVNDLDTTTTGTITASIDTTERVSELKTLTGTHAYTIVISEDDAIIGNAADLNTIDSATSVAVNASEVTQLTGTVAALKTAFAAGAAGTITGLNGAEAVILSDTEDASASDIHSLKNFLDDAAEDAGVSASAISLTNVTSLIGSAMDLLAVFAAKTAGTVSNLADDVDVTIDETGTGDAAVSVADANLIDSYTTGAITGTILETDSTTLSSLNSDTDNANAYTITVTGTADAGDLVTLETKTSVKVTMTGLTTVTGTLAEAEALFTLHNDEKVNLGSSPPLHLL